MGSATSVLMLFTAFSGVKVCLPRHSWTRRGGPDEVRKERQLYGAGMR
jgi:hypothetical protein